MREQFLGSLTKKERAELEFHWPFWARRKQVAPAGDWRFWMPLSGRGWGKTRTGAEWVRALAESGASRGLGIALVGATVGDARDIMIEGESGLLNICPPWFKPEWQASKRKLIWPNGEWARTYSADVPERLRGKQHAFAWCDELASWYCKAGDEKPEAWDQLLFGLRLGSDPRVCITTTPRPTPVIRSLVKDPLAHITTGTTFENAGNLAQAFIDTITAKYEGTRLGRQELYALILDDNPAALWNRAQIDKLRRSFRKYDASGKPTEEFKALKAWLKRIVVAIDPAISSEESSNLTGIVVCGIGPDGHGYVLEDASGRYRPAEWAQKALDLYAEWDADRIIAEVNQGGDLVENTLRSVSERGRHVAYAAVRASRGKQARAEPVSALYEKGKVHHVGILPQLEDQLCQWNPLESPESPDRLDAMVWGLTYLMLASAPSGGIMGQTPIGFM